MLLKKTEFVRTLFIVLLLVTSLAAAVCHFVFCGIERYSLNFIFPMAAFSSFAAMVYIKTKDQETSFAIGGIFFLALITSQYLYYEKAVFPRIDIEGKITTGEVIYKKNTFSGGGSIRLSSFYQYHVNGRRYVKDTYENLTVGQHMCIKYLVDRPDVHTYYQMNGSDCKSESNK